MGEKNELARFREECRAFFTRLWAAEQKPLVFGEGMEQRPPLMLIGEAPGQQEALQGKPFVGKAGQNLTEFLQVLGLRRDEIYISNVVKIRPTKPGKRGEVNRPPTREEIALFLPWLMREISLVRPQALVTLGNVALHAFVPASTAIGDCHGTWQQAVAAPPEGAALTLPLFALYHPASVIYNRALAQTYQRDLRALADSLRV